MVLAHLCHWLAEPARIDGTQIGVYTCGDDDVYYEAKEPAGADGH
jgi:hypothetical protein